MTDLVPFREDFTYRPQKRKDSASSKLSQIQVAGADFETKDGYPHIYTLTQYDKTTKGLEDLSIIFSGSPRNPNAFAEMNKKAFGKAGVEFNLKSFIMLHFQASKIQWKQGRKGKDGKKRTKKGKRVPMLWFFNLRFDAQAIIKTLPNAIIDYLYTHNKVYIDTKDWSICFLEKDKGRYTLDGKSVAFNRYIKLTYLPKKWMQIEPIMFYDKGIKIGKLDLWDIQQFYGGSLDYNAEKHLNENKLSWDGKDMNLLGSMSKAGQAFTVKYAKEIIEYAELDSNITQRLAWLKIREFESAGVRMVKPYSLASVAERAAYDRANIPTMDNMVQKHNSTVKAAWTAYQGGWFEARGSGTMRGVKAYDITSAYPHIMWWMPDLNDGQWVGTFYGEGMDEWEDYLKDQWKIHCPAFFEAEVIFPEGLKMYPAAKTSSLGCLQNPRCVYGWFTADEIVEFKAWGAEIGVERWTGFVPNETNEDSEIDDVQDGIRYPFRPFIKTFYTMKMEQDKLRDANDPAYDEAKRNVAKVMLNSLYGKTCQAIEDKLMEQKMTGQMWSSPYSAAITGATRARLGEFIRVNGYNNTLSVQTDGIILEGDNHILPPNHSPCYMDGELTGLGDWEDDGKGTLVLLMSGVYTILPNDPKKKVKSTYRGNYALFLDRKGATVVKYGANWAEFCELYGERAILERTATTDDEYSRPYSLGEARVKKDYSLVNQFRVIKTGIKAHGDSNKRNWQGLEKPTTFGDLADKWWESNTWEVLV